MCTFEAKESLMDDEPNTGGEPETLARCDRCGQVYPAQRTGTGALRPIGTAGSCGCGNDSFAPVSDD